MEHEKNAHILYCSDEDWEKVKDLLHPVRDAKEPTDGPEEIGYSLALPVLEVLDLGLGIDHYPSRKPVPHRLVGTNSHDFLYVDTSGKLAYLDLQSLAAVGDDLAFRTDKIPEEPVFGDLTKNPFEPAKDPWEELWQAAIPWTTGEALCTRYLHERDEYQQLVKEMRRHLPLTGKESAPRGCIQRALKKAIAETKGNSQEGRDNNDKKHDHHL